MSVSEAETTTALAATVRRADLASALAWVKVGLPRRPVVAVLAGIRIEASGASLSLGAFDYETCTRATVGCSGETDGVMLAGGAALVKAVQGFPKGATLPVRLEARPEGLAVSCGGVSVAIPALALEDYPQLPEMPPLSGHLGAGFGPAWDRVSVARGRDDTLVALTCVQVALGPDSAELVATDRYRLAVEAVPFAPTRKVPDKPLLLPVHGIATLAKGAREPLAVHVGKPYRSGREHYGPMVGLSDGWRELTVRAVDADYPKVRQHLGEGSFPSSVTVDAGALAAAVKRAGNVTERYEPVRLIATGRALTVQGISDGKAAASECVPAALTGAPVMRQFNPGYLWELLAGASGDAVLQFPAPGKPIRITAGAFAAILMPIRTGNDDDPDQIAAAAAAVPEVEEEASVEETETVAEVAEETAPEPNTREWRLAQGHSEATVDAAEWMKAASARRLAGGIATGPSAGRTEAGDRARATLATPAAEIPAALGGDGAGALAVPDAAGLTPSQRRMAGYEVDDGAVLWDLVRQFLSTYIAFRTQAELDLVTAWIFHAVARDRDDKGMGQLIWQASPRLLITSRSRGSGKSTVLDVILILTLSRRGKMPRVTPAKIAKVLGQYYETAAIDEAKAIFGEGKAHLELQACLLAGYTRRSSYEVSKVSLSLFGALAYAAKEDLITEIPADGTVGDLLDRSLKVIMPPPSRPMPEVGERAEQEGAMLGAALVAWTDARRRDLKAAARLLADEDHARALELHEQGKDVGSLRLIQITRPLRACARVAGPEAEEAIRQALAELTAGTESKEAQADLAELLERSRYWGTGTTGDDIPEGGKIVAAPADDEDWED